MTSFKLGLIWNNSVLGIDIEFKQDSESLTSTCNILSRFPPSQTIFNQVNDIQLTLFEDDICVLDTKKQQIWGKDLYHISYNSDSDLYTYYMGQYTGTAIFVDVIRNDLNLYLKSLYLVQHPDLF